jgi:hypothetical protein
VSVQGRRRSPLALVFGFIRQKVVTEKKEFRDDPVRVTSGGLLR